MKKLISVLIILFSTYTYSVEKCTEEQTESVDSLTNSPLNAYFVQKKEIKSISHPLQTSGKIWLSGSNQLVWQVLKPIKSTLVITQDGITQFNRKDIKQVSGVNLIGNDLPRVFLNVATGDFKSLKNDFHMDLSCQLTSWMFKLTPKNGTLIDILTSIEIYGEKTIQGFSYVEKRGDITRIELTAESSSFAQELYFFLPKNNEKSEL